MKRYLNNIKLFVFLCWEMKIIFFILIGLWLSMVGFVKFVVPGNYPGFEANMNPFNTDVYPTTQVKMTCWYDDQPVIFKDIIKISPSDKQVFTPKGQYAFNLNNCSIHTPNKIRFYGN